MVSGFNINELTNYDSQYWRVDWFGYLSYEDSSGQRRSEPLVDIYLSPFFYRPTPNKLNYKLSTNKHKVNRVQVPISYLRVIRLGDVWHQGKRFPLPYSSKMREKFRSVVISPEFTYTATAEAKGKLGDHLLPSTHHPYHKLASNVHCEFVKVDEDNLLIFPHYVLLQAYFSSSQYVFQQLFKFGLQFNSLYDPTQSYIRNDGHAFILLKKWTHDSAAPEVARLAFDEVAAKAIRRLSEGLSLQNINKSPISPKLTFPFQGKTTLDVYGKWCPLSSKRRVFIVYDILSCNANYPFASLTYFRNNPGDKKPVKTPPPSGKGKGTPPRGRPKPPPKEKDIDLHPDSEPRSNVDDLLVEGRAITQFPDLMDKSIEKKRQKDHLDENSTVGPVSSDDDLTGGNIGDGDTHGTAVPICFIPPFLDQEHKNKYKFSEKLCRLDLFSQLLNELSNCARITNTEIISIYNNLGKEDGNHSYFPTTYLESGKTSTWQYIHYIKELGFIANGDEKYRHRRAIIAKLTVANSITVFLAEAERRIVKVTEGWIELDKTAIFLALDRNEDSISKFHLQNLLSQSAEERGKWDHTQLPSNVESWSLRHAANDSIESGDYVHRQKNLIEKRLGFKLT
ncbi:hypothetical protein [Pseudoalteromonas ostreae]|uniref:hypothetical protein n=1 Tax=Pseudoalteromonas ostreae TaxID=2774154 RepID=UPI001B35F27B|nr:hypothetical protein [Pseudoalteromonas ostreae]